MLKFSSGRPGGHSAHKVNKKTTTEGIPASLRIPVVTVSLVSDRCCVELGSWPFYGKAEF
jgi:hypothetical protein